MLLGIYLFVSGCSTPPDKQAESEPEQTQALTEPEPAPDQTAMEKVEKTEENGPESAPVEKPAIIPEPVREEVALAPKPVAETPPPDEDIWSLLEKGDDTVQDFFMGKFGVNTVDDQGRTPLHIMAERRNAVMAGFFISIGAAVDVEDKQKRTPLDICALNFDAATAKVIAAAGANIHHAIPENTSPALIALNQQDSLLAAILTPASIKTKNAGGQTILHLAAVVGNARAIDTILAAGAGKTDIAERDNDDKTALDYALSRTDSLLHAEVVERLILAGATANGDLYRRLASAVRNSNYNTRGSGSTTLLHFTAREGYTGWVSFLLGKKADVNVKDSSGTTPLHEATRYGHLQAMTLLIDKGADLNAQDAHGNSALHLATPKDQYKDILELLLSHSANPNVRDEHGDSPLHIALTLNRDPAAIKMLLDHEADISIRNIEGKTPLYLVVQDERTEYIPLLLQYHASIFAVDNEGMTPFEKALSENLTSLTSLITEETVLQADGAGNTILHIVTSKPGNVETVNRILDRKAVINARNKEGDTALHIAIRQNNRDIGELLLSRGADIFTVNAKNESPLSLTFRSEGGLREWVLTRDILAARDGLGNTVLHCMVQQKLDEFIPRIIQMGASVEARNATGETPLFMAVKDDRESAMNTLITAGASIFARDMLGNTCLHAAVPQNAQKTAAVLIAAHIDVNAHAQNGKTALHEAVRLGMVEIEDMLITAGAFLESRDAEGNTPLMEAVNSRLPVTVERLIKRDADPNTRNAQGDTPLHLAVDQGRGDLVKILTDFRASIHAKNAIGMTPYKLALLKLVASPPSNVIPNLLTEDRISVPDDEGASPLHIAITENAPIDVIRYIVENKGRLTAVDYEGRTPLWLAVNRWDWDSAKVLIDAGADLFFAAGDGQCPAEIILSQGSEAINALFTVKSINNRDLYANTVLHYAARTGNAEIVSLLMTLGADKTIKNITGETAADIAEHWNRDNLLSLLR
jgi:ankyrin repeat protein